MKKIILPGLVAGTAMFIAGIIFSQMVNFIFPGLAKEYQNPGLFRPWSDPLMSLYFFYPFILGLVLAWFWNKTKEVFNPPAGGKKYCSRGICFGMSYWLIASIPGMFITFSSFPVSLLMVISWSLSGLIDAIIAGLILARMNK